VVSLPELFLFFPERNQIYCKNCGSVNQFNCNHKGCNNSVKDLQIPNSVEEKLKLLNKVMTFKSYVEKANKDVEKEIKETTKENPVIFTNSFIEETELKNKEMITNSFIGDIQKMVNEEKGLEKEIDDHNKKQIEYVYYGGNKKTVFVYIIIGFLLLSLAFIGYKIFSKEVYIESSKKKIETKSNNIKH